ncbi:MAG: hypothetical protein UR98_C0003G0059 [Parcubacteria group bacterium GW2011_GWA1_36_12]|nr:MAG: hypothetical protein UR98_C0003G0059 [Parcubacteria group bacterium GW2011_GWA1_36_12]
MRILFVTPPPYLPNRLHRNRSFDLIRILARKHQVHLLCVVTDQKVYPEFKEIKKVCRSVKVIRISKFRAMLNVLFFPHLPAEVAFCNFKKAQQEIEKIVKDKKIDLVYIKRLRSVVFVPEVDVPMVVDTTDAMSLFYDRLARNSNFPKTIFYLLESLKYKWYEKKVAQKFKNWIISSPLDEKYLKRVGLKINTHVVPNAVNIDYFKSSTANFEQNTLLFSGLMDKPVNIDAAVFFAREIFPLIKKEVADVKLYIVGPNPSIKVRNLNSDGIFVKGHVKDLRQFIAKSQIVVAPIRIATGVRNKILQGWAMGKPVVSTTIGAEGLKARDGENILIADSATKFADDVVKILKNKQLYNKLAKNGRKTVEAKYSYQSISNNLEEVLRDVRKSKKTASK